MYSVAARRPEPRRERVDERLDDVREARLQADHEQEAEHAAAEHGLVDERGRDRVEQRRRVRAGRPGSAGGDSAATRSATRLAIADRRRRRGPKMIAPSAVAEAQEQVVPGSGWIRSGRRRSGRCPAVPGQPAAQRRASAVSGRARRTRPRRSAGRRSGAGRAASGEPEAAAAGTSSMPAVRSVDRSGVAAGTWRGVTPSPIRSIARKASCGISTDPDALHALLAFLLLLEQLALAGDVATVALGQHVLAHRADRLAGDDVGCRSPPGWAPRTSGAGSAP